MASRGKEMSLSLFRICSNCNKEFQITKYFENSIEAITTIENCPHCKARNDIWVSIKKVSEEEQ